MSEWWQESLDDLRWHWGDAYLIHYFSGCGEGKWVAQRRDSHATMGAADPIALLDLIREDYRQHPSPRLTAGVDRPSTSACRFPL